MSKDPYERRAEPPDRRNVERRIPGFPTHTISTKELFHHFSRMLMHCALSAVDFVRTIGRE
jgi:hypothetical protein